MMSQSNFGSPKATTGMLSSHHPNQLGLGGNMNGKPPQHVQQMALNNFNTRRQNNNNAFNYNAPNLQTPVQGAFN